MEKLKQLPLGYRFIPTDSELIIDYLIQKLKNQQLCCNAVVEQDIYTTEPWNLKGNNNNEIGGEIEKGYYFVNRKKKTAASKTKPNRSVNPGDGSLGGFWKATGADKEILDKRNKLVGVKKLLKYHCYTTVKRMTKDKKPTGWIMHEYTLPPREDEFQPWVLCSIRFNGDDVEYQQHQKLKKKAVVPEHQEVVLEQYDQQGKQQQQQQQLLMPRFKDEDMIMLDYAKGGGGGGLPQACEASSSSAMLADDNVHVPAQDHHQLTNAYDYRGGVQEWDDDELDRFLWTNDDEYSTAVILQKQQLTDQQQWAVPSGWI